MGRVPARVLEAGAVTFVPPLVIHLCWFPGTVDPRAPQIARELYEVLHRPLEDDGVRRPGLEISVEIGRDFAGLVAALDAGTEAAAEQRIVIALLDNTDYADAKARAIVARAAARSAANETEILVPILLGPSWRAELAERERLIAGLTVELVDDPLRLQRLGSEIAVICGRALRGRIRDDEPLRPWVFPSYVREDHDVLARELSRHFNDTPLRAETAHPLHGQSLADRIVKQRDEAVVLVLRSDRYSEDVSCGIELLAAKRAKVPIVTLLAIEEGESAASAYGGNHRTMAWSAKREWDVTLRCAQAWLHEHHFRAYAKQALARTGLPADTEVLARRPELIDLISLRVGNRLIVHPDPPLTEPEAQLLRDARPEIRLATPRTMMGRVLLDRDPKPPLANMEIAFSLSVAHELPPVRAEHVGRGLTSEHMLEVLNSIVLATLYSGARISFGGDFRTTGYTQHLADLHRSRRRLGTGAGAQLVCFVDRGTRDGDADRTEYQPREVTLPPELDALPPAQRNWVWLSTMRMEMAKSSHARILLGGKSHPTQRANDDGFYGPWSGLVEEAWGTLEQGKALYIVGGYSGIAGLITEMLQTGAAPKDLQEASWRTLVESRLAEVQAVRDRYPAQVAFMLGTDRFCASILAHWNAFVGGDVHAWNNGLTVDENRQLFTCTDRTEITFLIFEGLRRLARASAPAIQLSLYNGDIATATADGYAVTVTPNVPAAGASLALDHRLDGALGRTTLLEGDLVTVVGTAGSQLAGSSVLLARLDLPPAGTELQDTAVAALATRVAVRADELGLQSLACTPFGVTLGIDVLASARAMALGAQAANVSGVTSIVMCELDPKRYDALVAAFPTATLLRPSTQPVPVVPASATLQVDTIEEGDKRNLRATLLSPQLRDAFVPRSDVAISAADWTSLATRRMAFDETLAVGRTLWASLGPAVQQRLHTIDASLTVLTDEVASGLPWELLVEGDRPPFACVNGIVRRVSLPNASLVAPDPVRRESRLRILLLADPSLPEAVDEIEEVRRAMSTRGDFAVEILDFKDVTVAALQTKLRSGNYAVLHYAGHAMFDDADPTKSGLCLANNEVFRGDHLGTLRPPRLVVLSACQSGRVRAAQGLPVAPRPASYSLTESFLRNGVTALVGTFFTVDSGAAMKFAIAAQNEVVKGQSIGAAVRAGRRVLFDERSVDWANFMLFGDSTLTL